MARASMSVAGSCAISWMIRTICSTCYGLAPIGLPAIGLLQMTRNTCSNRKGGLTSPPIYTLVTLDLTPSHVSANTRPAKPKSDRQRAARSREALHPRYAADAQAKAVDRIRLAR